MTWQHLRTILWLRWRMSLNQLRRSGLANRIILAILALFAVATAIGMFFVALLVGMFAFPNAPDAVVMYVWDAVVAAFLLFWMTGLLTELQRSEVLSLQKLLHLPISLTGTFLINYIGSLVSLSLVVFLPGMVGLSIALVIAKGPAMLMLFPLLATFLLMVTALTYQFQGWLAALMMNQRRRRSILAIITVSFIVISQLPNLLNAAFWRSRGHEDALAVQLRDSLARLDQAHARGEVDAQQYARQREALLSEHQSKVAERSQDEREGIYQIVTGLNLVLPVGWLPYGAMACVAGNIVPGILGTAGAGLIGAASLWRSYRTTLRWYTGQFTSGRPRRVRAPVAVQAVPTHVTLLERQLPGLSEHASAIALANFRSLTRAPEAKMLLLTPTIMVIMFGSMLLTRKFQPPDVARPFMGFAAVAMIMLSMMQLLGNQFGFDRDGFRALVLSASPRQHILLGKNLSVAPLALGLGSIAVVVLQVVYPMRITHFFSTLAELVQTYLILCMVGNFTSILAPMHVAAGSLKPAHPKALTVLVQFIFVFLVFPLLFAIALIPLGLELLFHHLGWLSRVPIYALCALVQLAIVTGIYRYVVVWQGRMLHAHEKRILSVVTTKAE